MRRQALVLVALAVATGCRDAGGTGSLTAEWSTTDTAIGNGRMTVPARGWWCAETGRFTIVGMRADSGLGILIRSDAIRTAELVVVDTATSGAPAAVVALRLVRGARLVALSSDSGTLSLRAAGGTPVAGTYQAWFREPGTATPVQVRGGFSGVEPASDSATCGAAPPTALPADSVVFY